MTKNSVCLSFCACLWAFLVPGESTAQTPIIQPGAPGESAQELSADEAI